MDNLYWLDNIKLQDRTQVGDKAFDLSRIMQRGYPVLPGFVVSADVWREFLETLNSSDSLVADLPNSSLHLNVNNWQQLQQVAQRLREEVIAATIPNDWVQEIFQATKTWYSQCLILRPSLNIVSGTQVRGHISGIFESVFCLCDSQAIEAGLKQIWSQLFRARSLLYWHSIGINLQQINLAVLVQPVENVIASGSFKANTYGSEIEATYGLGIALKKGEVLPDIYYLEEGTELIKEKQLGQKIIAYQIGNHQSFNIDNATNQSALINNRCCWAYALNEEQQKNYVLSEAQLKQIIILGNQLIQELSLNLTIQWTIKNTKLYITNIKTSPSGNNNLQLIKGIGAAKGRVKGSAYIVLSSQTKLEKIPTGVILIAPSVTNDWLPLLHKVAGIITEKGGLTSHAAILSRELNIPAVVSVRNITNLVQTGDKLLLDGDRGEIYRNSEKTDNFADQELEKVNNEQENSTPGYSTILTNNHIDSISLPLIATQLLVNISQPKLIKKVKNLPIDGIGLLRSELMILNLLGEQNLHTWLLEENKIEFLEKLTNQIEEFAKAFYPKPILYRSLDWQSDNLDSLTTKSKLPQKSILGKRGTLSYVHNPRLFELELRALSGLQKKGYTNINLMLPFVRTVEEFVFCRRQVEEFGLTQNPHFQLWIMAEVPSILFLLPEYIKAGVAGISIGTNDLTQLILGADREEGELAGVLDERHPAVMTAISQIIKMAKAGGIPCSICGQAPALYPEIINKLIEWGITSISVEPEAVEKTYIEISRAEKRLILDAARKQIMN